MRYLAELLTGLEESENPMILLSHIPLARPEMANCGPYREKGTIRRDVGHGFQSMLGRETTGFLLKTLEPLAVFR
jgi:ethanolamine phosphate phosphodiesterase